MSAFLCLRGIAAIIAALFAFCVPAGGQLLPPQSSAPQRVLEGFTDYLPISLAFSSDGRILVGGGGGDKRVRIWDVPSGKLLRTIVEADREESVALSPNGRLVAAAQSHADRPVTEVWDVQTGKRVRVLAYPSPVHVVAFSPNGRLLATGSWAGTTRLWDVASGALVRTLGSPSDHFVSTLAFSPDGRTLATGARETNEAFRLWDVDTGELRRIVNGDPVQSLAYSPDGNVIASFAIIYQGGSILSLQGVLSLWDPVTGQGVPGPDFVAQRDLPLGPMAFSPDGNILAVVDLDLREHHQHRVRLWDLRTKKWILSVVTKGDGIVRTGDVASVAFSPDGKTLAAAIDYWVVLWDVSEAIR